MCIALVQDISCSGPKRPRYKRFPLFVLTTHPTAGISCVDAVVDVVFVTSRRVAAMFRGDIVWYARSVRCRRYNGDM